MSTQNYYPWKEFKSGKLVSCNRLVLLYLDLRRPGSLVFWKDSDFHKNISVRAGEPLLILEFHMFGPEKCGLHVLYGMKICWTGYYDVDDFKNIFSTSLYDK